jgi:hypothetical protein
MPSLTDAYLAEFDRALGFDRRLARRVHDEIEAHLCDAVADDTDDEGAERRAIARFGNPQVLARDYAQAALPARLRMTWAVAITMALATFALMRLRSTVLALPGMEAGSNMLLAVVDRAAFGAGIFFSLYAWHRARSAFGTVGAERMLSPLSGAAAAFLLSVFASVSRATMATGGDPLIWITGSLEMLLIGSVGIQLRLLHRHVGLASTPA